MKTYRVYNLNHTPLEGSNDFVDLRRRKDAIAVARLLTTIDKNNEWVWACLEQ